MTATAEGGYSFLKERLWVEAAAGYSASTRADLTLSDPTADYAQGVLLKDMDYYSADYWQGRLQLTYQLPITIKKTRSMWYVRGYYQYLGTVQHSLHQHSFGFTLGMFN